MADFSKWDRWLLAAILAAAFAIRIIYLIDIADSIYLEYPVLDSCWYHTKALDVLHGDYLASSASFRVPLYVYFLAACYRVFGQSFAAPLIMQAVLGSVSCGLVFMIARRLFGRPAGAIAGFGLAFYRMAIYSDGEILPTTLFLFFMLVAVWLVLKCLDSRRYDDAALTGVFLGLGFLTRPDVLPFAVVMMVVVVLILRSKRGLRLAASVAIVFAGFLMLLGVRNYAAYQRFFLFSPQGAVNFYIGNAGFADGKTPMAPPTEYVYSVAMDPGDDSMITGCRTAARESVGRDLADDELSTYYIRKTIAEIKSDLPGRMRLLLKKSYYFLNSYERSGIKPVQRFVEKHTHVLKLPLVTYALVMPLGLVGLFMSLWNRRRHALVAAAGLITFSLITIAFFVMGRIRLPAVPFMAILGGYAVHAMAEAATERRYGMLAWALGVAIALWAFSETRFFDIDSREWLPTYIVNEGALYEKAGRYDEAIEAYGEASALDPGDARPYYHLGRASAGLGNMAEAGEYMAKAVTLNPNYRPFAHMALGTALAKGGNYAEAAVHFSKALDADPGICLAAYNLGLCQYNLGQLDEAAGTLVRASEICRDDASVAVPVARLLIDLGETERGIALGRAVLESDPRNPEAMYAVGMGLEDLGRYDEAAALYKRALRYLPSSKELRERIERIEQSEPPRRTG